jgi:RNA polymerase sigma-70 factor (ECF subfamily)
MPGLTDARLLEEELWAEARRRGLSVARRYARSADEVEDIVQEALLRAWRRRGSLRERERFHQWLATIVRHEAARLSARHRPEPIGVASEARADDRGVLEAEARADVERGLRQLDAADRLLIQLRYEADLTQAAIANRLELPEGTVKVRLHRARLKLQRALNGP